MNEYSIQNVAIELTNFCNLKCEICWSQNPKLFKKRVRGYMNLSLFEFIIKELEDIQEKHGKRLRLSLSYGGEALLHPQFKEILGLINKKRFTTYIYSNGYNVLKYLDYLRYNDVNIHLSLHRDNVEQIYNITNKMRIIGIKPRINIVEGEFPVDELKNIIKPLQFISYLSLNPYITEDLQYVKPMNLKPCIEPFHYLAILWDGETYPCCHLLSTNNFSMGNIKYGIKEVWNGEKYQKLRKGVTSNTPCEYCKLTRRINKID